MKKVFKRNISLLLTALLLLSVFSISLPAHAENDGGPNIYLKGIENEKQKNFTTSSTEIYNQGEVGPYIVTFNGPVHDFMKNQIENNGAEIVEYIPDFSFMVMMTPENAENINNLSYVENVMVYDPIFKIDPDFIDNAGNIKDLGEIKVRILTFDNYSTENQIQSFNIEQIDNDLNSIIALINSDEIMKLASLNSIKFIEPIPEFVLFNDVAKGYMGTEGILNLGYTGEGQVVGIADTGLDTGTNDSSMHRDFQGRINKIIALGRSVADDPHGHGTHVAGSVLGDGTNSNGQIKGIAPMAHLVFQSILDSRDGLGGLPNDLNNLFKQAWNEGARIHTNSWGAPSNGAYNSYCRQVDEYVWNNDMTILFAAGNEGQSKYTGSIIYNSIGTPGSAKNCITVGASENNRADKGKLADNPNEIAAFSSRGHCKDGRIKPDIIAPGTWILSTKSSKAPTKNFWGEYNDKYAYMGGTSMATPLTAGAVAVARQYIINEWNHTPTPAMMKAVVINGATDMGYGYMGKDQGWGRINLVDSLKSKEYKYVDTEKSLSTGEVANYTYSVASNKTPLKVTLTWTDYPGSTSASKALVNDLDLKITSPSGVVYYGNDFSKTNNIDRLNNVENVFINEPEIGNYQVEVIAYNIPQGPQPFALFASADFGTENVDKEIPTCSITSPLNNSTINGKVSINANAEDNVGVTKVEFYVDNNHIGTDTTQPYSIEWDTTTVDNGEHILQVKAYDAAGNIGTSSGVSVNINNQVEDPVNPDTEYVTESYSGSASWWESYEKSIDVTATGTITIELPNSSSLSTKLYDPTGKEVASGTNSIIYKANSTGKYTIVVNSSSFWGSSFTLNVTYPMVKKGNVHNDTEAPTCNITSPLSGETVNGIVTVNATAEDNVEVTKVEFFADGQYLGNSTTAPYSIEWDTTAVNNGEHMLQVKAYDTAGNVGTSNEISVNVNNEVENPEQPEEPEKPETEYITETYTGSTSLWKAYEKTIDVTTAGTIIVELSSDFESLYGMSLTIKLYDPSGNLVANDINSVTCEATTTGKYTIVVSTEFYDSFVLDVTYPIAK